MGKQIDSLPANKPIQRLIQGSVMLLAGLFLLLLLAGCGATTQSLDELPTPTPLPTPVVPEKPTYTVQQGTVINALVFNGRVSPIVEEQLSFGKPGTVRAVFVSQGDEVEAGTVLAELDISEIEKEIQQAEINLATAIAGLEKAEREHAENLLKAEIDMRKGELEAQKAAAEQSSISDLTQKLLDLQKAQEAVGAAAQGYQEALSNTNVPQEYIDGLARGLEESEQALLLAEVTYQDALRKDGAKAIDAQIKELDQLLKEAAYQKLLEGPDNTAEVAVQKAELALQEAREKLENAQLTAPFSGRILNITIRKGSQVEALRTVLVIGQVDNLEVTANLDATDLAKLSVEARATIRLRNRPEQPLEGHIRQLPYPFSGGTGSGPGTGQPEDRSVRIQIDTAGVSLTLGELAEVTVVLEEKENVLWLPPAAIRRFQGRRFVVVQTPEGGQQRVDVRLGIESSDRVEILEGLEAGQIVIGE